MFGISWAEFLVIFLVAVVVLPTRLWPDVARFLARAVNFIRAFMWRIADTSEQIKNQIDLQKPIDELIHTTTRDILNDFSDVRPVATKKSARPGRGKRKK